MSAARERWLVDARAAAEKEGIVIRTDGSTGYTLSRGGLTHHMPLLGGIARSLEITGLRLPPLPNPSTEENAT